MKFTLSKTFETFFLIISAAFIFITIVALLKYILISFSGLYESAVYLLKNFFNGTSSENTLVFQSMVILKIFSLIAALGLVFVLYSVLSAIYSCVFYRLCTVNFKKVNYMLKYCLIKGIKWNFYRTFIIFAPPLSVITAAFFLFTLCVVFFNLFIKITGISITLSVFVISFALLSILFLFVLSILFSFWQYFSTILGVEIAVSEPKLRNKTIENRAKKIIFAKKYNFLLCLSYLIFVFNIIIQLKYALESNLLQNSDNNFILSLVILFNLACLTTLEYLKAYNYVDSLVEYSKKAAKESISIIMPNKK